MMCGKVPLSNVVFETKCQCFGVDCQVLSDDVVTEKLYWKAPVFTLSENGSLIHFASKPGMWKNCSTSDSGLHEW